MNLVWIVIVGTLLFLTLGISLIGAIALSQRRNLRAQAQMMSNLNSQIEDRKRAEKEVQEGEQRYRRLVEDTNAMYCILDRELRILYATPNLRSAAGLAEFANGYPFAALIHRRDRRRVINMFTQELPTSAEDVTCEFRLAGKKARAIWVEQVTRSVRDHSGTINEFRSVLRDVTVRKDAELMQRTLSHRIVEAQEAERRRVARDLHDGVIQLLSSVQFRLKSGGEMRDRKRISSRAMGEASRLLDESISEIRRISHNLRPSILDDLGLEAAIRSTCEEFSERTGIKTQLNLSTSKRRFPEIVELTCYRVVQEVLNNVDRHSRATEVSLSLIRHKDLLVTRIVDNGRGLDPSSLAVPHRDGTGTGIEGMKERVQFLGGHFELKSAQGEGVEVFIQLPARVKKNGLSSKT